MKPTAHYWLAASLLLMSLLWLGLFGNALWEEPALPNAASMGVPSPPSISTSTPAPSSQPAPARMPQTGIVIVVDDMGESLAAAQSLLQLPFPVVLSIWPHSRLARQTAELAHSAGREVFIHLPMQPLGAARRNVGPPPLMAGDSPRRMAALVEEARRLVPHAVGINNHMGSRATTHTATMNFLCDVLRPTGLVVLDSVTHPSSLLYTTARKYALPALRRQLFLDHVQDRPSVLAQLEKARRLSQSQLVVVIGHPHGITLEALRHWGPPADVSVLTARQAVGATP